MKKGLFITLLFVFWFNRIAYSEPLVSVVYKDTVDVNSIGFNIKGNTYNIIRDVDLKGSVCKLPKGVTIKAQGGIIKNGVLVGDNTKIRCSGSLFENVLITGTWQVPTISSSIFVDNKSVNSLKNLMSLTSPIIANKVIIEEGSYLVSAYSNEDVCIPIKSNTEVIILGDIHLLPNSFTDYDIIRIEGRNIKVNGNGKGTIRGDRFSHTGKDGEWGMGVRIHNAYNVSVTELSIKECWGDCIYVGGGSNKVQIEKCFLSHGRRQGISITKAKNVRIKHTIISDISGTEPEYAIDIEPNANDKVDNIIIDGVEAYNCNGGFLVYGSSTNAKIGRVIIKNSKTTANNRYTLYATKCTAITLKGCEMRQLSGKRAVYCYDVGRATIHNNLVSTRRDDVKDNKIKKHMQSRIVLNDIGPITIDKCASYSFSSNYEIPNSFD